MTLRTYALIVAPMPLPSRHQVQATIAIVARALKNVFLRTVPAATSSLAGKPG